MSDLTVFRDHALNMAMADHTPECVDRLKRWTEREAVHRWFDVPDPGPRPECPGCVTSADRILWKRMADEVDGYLTPDDEPLFESEGA